MTTDEKIQLITRNLEETLTEEELKQLIESGTPLRHYIGFEISGKLHIGHFFQLLKVKDMQDAGAETIIWLADIHSAINDKLGGDLETIKKVGREYFIPAMKVLFECIGGDPEKLDFRFTSEEYAKNPDFWLTFLEVGKTTTLARNLRSITIMGREQSEDIDSAKLMYPILQAADIYLLQVNIAQAGIDQRKVHVVAREAANQVKTFALKNNKGESIKPIAIHTPILLGLDFKDFIPTGEVDEVAMKTKMSKSKADSAVSIHDAPDDIKNKINKSIAQIGNADLTVIPILNWTRYLIFYQENASLTVNFPEKFGGGSKIYHSYKELKEDYESGDLHPQDLKIAVADWLIQKLEPARKHFEDPSRKQALAEITKLTTKI